MCSSEFKLTGTDRFFLLSWTRDLQRQQRQWHWQHLRLREQSFHHLKAKLDGFGELHLAGNWHDGPVQCWRGLVGRIASLRARMSAPAERHPDCLGSRRFTALCR